MFTKKQIRHFKSPGGSAALTFLEVAKGVYTLARDWNHESQIYDHTAMKLVTNAGGKTVDIDGCELPLEGFTGLMFSGGREDHVDQLRQMVLERLPNAIS